MSKIKIGVVGKIIEGEEAGSFVKIEDDSDSTGGFLILTSTDPNFRNDGFDNWVRNEAELAQYFDDSRWKIAWNEEAP